MPLLAAGPIDPTQLLDSFGLAGLLIILFAECGLLIGFFLPGDTLLFAAGLLIATDKISTPLWVYLVLAPVAAVAGNLVGYWIGYRAGPSVFDRPNSRFFRPEYVERSQRFFDRFGAWTIVLARFVPIVRTIALFSVVGGVAWTVGVILAGYWLGHIDFVRNTIEPKIDYILLAAVLLSLVPVAVHALRGRRADRAADRAPEQPADTAQRSR